MKKTVAALLAAALLLTAPALPAAAANGPTETAAQDAGAIIGENSAKAGHADRRHERAGTALSGLRHQGDDAAAGVRGH